MKIPMSSPDLTNAEKTAVLEVLDSRFLSRGPYIERFEAAFRRYLGVSHSIGVSSGTSGLHLSIIAAGVEDGDLVITTPYSFVASANCILYERATPIFVDVDPATGNIDTQHLVAAAEGLIEGGAAAEPWLPPTFDKRRVKHGELKAILPVHVYGQPADMGVIRRLADQLDLAVIEDACEALGAERNGRKSGTWGDMAIFAFYPNKQITTGEGGMIVTGDTRRASLMQSLRNQGRSLGDDWLSHVRVGYNYRLDEMSAALGLAQLARLEELMMKRDRVAQWYHQRLDNVEGVAPPNISESTTRMSWFVYVVRIDPRFDRAKIARRLQQVGIPSRTYFAPIHLQGPYKQRFGYRHGQFPNAEELGSVSLALPFSSIMTEAQVDFVCKRLSEAISGMHKRR